MSVFRFAIPVVALLSVLRVAICSPSIQPMPDVNDRAIRAEVTGRIDAEIAQLTRMTPRLKSLGVRSIVAQHFDSDASVMIDVGPDGAFGVLGIDDGNNGIIDDPSELGATGSDDTLTLIAGGDPMESSPTAAVIARGGMVPAVQQMQIDQVIVVGIGFEFLIRRGTDF